MLNGKAERRLRPAGAKIERSAAEYIPPGADLAQLAPAAQQCKGCDLYKHATQAVLGAGPSTARVVMIGEQPGDQEDRAGQPFVGPAGRLLDRAMQDAGIARPDVYITNAVKHFKFEERGRRRIHKKPSAMEIDACHPWLEAELALIRPQVIVCLGATAARSVFGRQQAVLAERGKLFEHPVAGSVTVTLHPSAILRSPDPVRRRQDYEAFVRDLKVVRAAITKMHAEAG